MTYGLGLEGPGLGLEGPGLGLEGPGLGLEGPGLGLKIYALIYLTTSLCFVQVKCVVSGCDSDLTYSKVAKAVSYLRTPGCLFVCTNTDTGLPCGRDCMLPGMSCCCLISMLPVVPVKTRPFSVAVWFQTSPFTTQSLNRNLKFER